MLKLFLILYFTCYSCYIFYTREPDYFDGENVAATIVLDNKTNEASAVYQVGEKAYTINASYPLRHLQNNEEVTLIYLPQHPEKAAVYSIWGYWFRWSELAMSIILLFGLYQLSVSITKNPTAEALKNQQQTTNEPARKYTDFTT